MQLLVIHSYFFYTTTLYIHNDFSIPFDLVNKHIRYYLFIGFNKFLYDFNFQTISYGNHGDEQRRFI